MANRSRIILGALFILGGLIFLLDAADIIPARDVLSDWWPLIIIGLGVLVLFGRPRSWTGGGILIAIGAILLLATLDILDISLWQLIIPLILIGAGLSLVIRGISRGLADRSNRVNLLGVLSEQEVRSNATAFEHAALTSVLGEVTMDLRQATLTANGADIDTFCLLGEIKIIAPRGWRIHVDGMPILGDFKDETEYTADMSPDAPVLLVTGVSIFGDVTVRHV
jgi:predicted membrane protein